MKLIRETVEETKLIVEEKLGKGKQYFIEGIFLQSQLKNRNGRMYPEHTMDREVGRYLKESVQANRAYGELGHPDTPSIKKWLSGIPPAVSPLSIACQNPGRFLCVSGRRPPSLCCISQP